ncbi:MAG: hypothetical protein Q8L21_03095, partial [Candidatus Komeilibacteria bacterium]|nr:hypothetical protein [Candidatus Komeilibacteria bacterium]
SLALPFFSSVIAERVNKLADDSYAPKFKLWGKGLAFGLMASVLTVLMMLVFLSDTSQALAMHREGNCALDYFQSRFSACAGDMAAAAPAHSPIDRPICQRP